MSVLQELVEREHENVAFFRDYRTGLVSIIAVHSTVLGPSLGGCRMRAYASVDEALGDVLKLSEAMTFKNSLAGLNLGGGKSVIIADGALKEGRGDLFRTYGKWVKSLNGSYIAAEDMGTSVDDMNYVLEECDFVAGRDPKNGGGGDPSPYTALGVFDGIRASLERAFGSGDFKGRHVAIQGVGHVGHNLAKLLAKAGAQLTITDTRDKVLATVCEEVGGKAVPLDAITSVECDVFAPCAVGGTVNIETIGKLKCKIVAGAANNQIAGGSDTEKKLIARGILYAPDFAINAGGVILCAGDLEPGGFKESWVMERVSRIYGTVGRILDEAKKTGELPGSVAVRLAKERIDKARK